LNLISYTQVQDEVMGLKSILVKKVDKKFAESNKEIIFVVNNHFNIL